MSRRALLFDQILQKGRRALEEGRNRIMASIAKSSPLPALQDRVNKVMSNYEDFIGIKQVKEAQERVLTAETHFKSSQQERRSAQEKLAMVQTQLRSLRMEIDRTARGDNRYLELIKKEIDIIQEERQLRTTFETLEAKEREFFSELSNGLRMSHEKERAQSEKTKYWSVVGSVIGAGLGILGTTINSRIRHNHTKDILAQTSAHVQQIEDSIQALLNQKGGDRDERLPLPEHFVGIIEALQGNEEKLENSVKSLLNATESIEKSIRQLTISHSGSDWNNFNFLNSNISSGTIPITRRDIFMISVSAVIVCICTLVLRQ